jgi:DNA-binding SARP family transcriptional activator
VTTPGRGHSRAVHIELLSGASIRSDNDVVAALPAGSRAAVALARLAVAPAGTVTRDGLADAVWGDKLPPTWQAALRNVVADVRETLTQAGLPGGLRAVDGGYSLDLPRGSTVDVLTLERDSEAAGRALRSGDHAAALRQAASAVDLAGRPVLPGAQTEWVDALRDRVQDMRAALAVSAAEATVALGDFAAAERLARIAVDAAPSREDGHRLLIRALAASGNRGAALAAYERCRDSLEREFGTRPSEETERVRREVLGEPSRGRNRLGATPAIGAWPRNADYGLGLARTALEAGEFEDAVGAASRALDVLTSAGEPDPLRRLDLLIVLGAAQRALGDEDGFGTLDGAVAKARELGDSERLAEAALAFAHSGAAADESYVDDLKRDLYEEALTALGGGDPARRARLLGHLAVAHAFVRGGPEGRRAGEEALALARLVGDDGTRVRVLTTVRRSLTGALEVELQERIEDELLALAERLDDPGAQARALLWRFHTRVEQGRGDDLETLLDAADRVVAGLRMAHYHHTLAYTRAALVTLRGDLATGEALLEEAAAIGRGRGLAEPIIEAIRLAQLVAVRHEQGRAAELRDQAVALFGGAGLPPWLGMVALVEAEAGHAEAADRALAGFLDNYARSGPTLLGPVGVAAHTAHPIARLRARAHAETLHPLIAPFAGRAAYLAYFAGPVDFALGLLAETLGRPGDAGRHFADATAFCERLDAPLWTQRCREHAAGRA